MASMARKGRVAPGLAWVLLIAVLAVPAEGAASSGPGTPASGASCPATADVVRTAAPGRGRTVALTFDDGPGPSTGAILRVLARRGARATFFNIGRQLAGHVRLLRREVRLREALGNHTWDHPDLTTLSAKAQAAEIDRATRKLIALIGVRPCLFRPPYGAYDSTTRRLALKRRLAFWMWSVDTEDWKAAGSSSRYWVHRIVTRAEAGVAQPHPVILLHNPATAAPATVRALPRIITFYRRHHYRFVVL